MAPPIIRAARDDDVAGMLAIYAPAVRDSAISFEETMPDPDEFRRRLRAIAGHYPWLVCARDDRVLGYAYAARFHPRVAYQWTVETTVYVAAEAHRQGIGRALYTSVLECVRLQGHQTVVGIIALPNAGSVGLHEALGFTAMGVLPNAGHKHGAWHDVGYWSLPLARDPHPAPPVPPAALTGDPRWGKAITSGERHLGG